MNKIHVILALILILSAFSGTCLPTRAADASGDQISITDSRGITTNLSQPAEHYASFGAFATNTLVDLGFLNAVVIFDSYSEFSKSEIPEMENMSANMFITVSSTNKDLVVQKMLELVDDGTWNKTTDVIFGYGYSYLSTLWTELEGYGFHVITFYPNSYDGIVQVVEDIETVVGADHSVSEHMIYVKTYIAQTLEEKGITNSSEKIKALYVSYSSTTLKLANNGSVTVDFINFAGGINVAEDSSKTSPTYSTDLTAILQLNPTFVLLDGYYPGTAEEFSADIGNNDITVYKMNKSWNSYCPDATEGLWVVACLFYPDIFQGEMPVKAAEPVDNTLIYVAAISVVAALVVVSVLVIKMKAKRD